MISKSIQSRISSYAWKLLEITKDAYTWEKGNKVYEDDPTILWLIFTKMKLSTNIDVKDKIARIERATMSVLNNNPTK
eukprot:14959323-Ditylum_brightwellii.AAC.2